MNYQTADVFFSDIEANLEKNFKDYKIEILVKTQKSLKINIQLDKSFLLQSGIMQGINEQILR